VINILHRLCSMLNTASARFAGWHAAPPAGSLAVGFGLSLLAIAFLRGRRRALAILMAMLIPIVAAILVAHRGVDRVTMTVINVGQGDSILIRAPDRTMLIDG